MNRKLIKNTVFGGQLSNDASFTNLINMPTDRKNKNPLFSSIFAIDEEKILDVEVDDNHKNMPNDIYVLNYGFYLFACIENGCIVSKLEDENPEINSLAEVKKPGALCLATMLNQLISHLKKCYIELFSISEYIANKEDFGIMGSEVKAFTLRKTE